MIGISALVAFSAILAGAEIEPAHGKNAMFAALMKDGASLDGATIRLPAPKLLDDQTAEQQRATLKEVAGGDRALKEFLSDSVTAPFVLKVRDEATPGDATIRMADLSFAVHADFARLDPAEAARRSAGKVTEVANMRIESKLLSAQDLNGIESAPPDPTSGWWTHLSSRLLDRVEIETTDRAVVSRTERSMVVASRREAKFDNSSAFPNLWRIIGRDGRPLGEGKPYAGGVSYCKISRLADDPKILVVEAHFAFAEPKEWFDGKPILRSKFAPIAQDQVRRLRRESRSK